MGKFLFLTAVILTTPLFSKTVDRLYPLEKFSLFVKSDKGPKLLEVGIDLEFSDEKVADRLKLEMPAIRHSIRDMLGRYSETMGAQKGRLKLLRGDIKSAINRKLRRLRIKDVHFTEFQYK